MSDLTGIGDAAAASWPQPDGQRSAGRGFIWLCPSSGGRRIGTSMRSTLEDATHYFNTFCKQDDPKKMATAGNSFLFTARYYRIISNQMIDAVSCHLFRLSCGSI